MDERRTLDAEVDPAVARAMRRLRLEKGFYAHLVVYARGHRHTGVHQLARWSAVVVRVARARLGHRAGHARLRHLRATRRDTGVGTATPAGTRRRGALALLGPVHAKCGRCVGSQCGWMREGWRCEWPLPFASRPTKQAPHFGPTLREGEWRAHCVVAASLVGTSQRRSPRLALHPAIRLRTPGFSVNRP